MKKVEYLGNKIFSIEGLIQSTSGILSLSEEIMKEYSNIFSILTNHFNQDPIENMFSYIRAKGGHSKNPSVHEFNIILAKLISLKLIHFNTSSNCIEDDATMLSVNIQNIYEETDNSESSSENNSISFISMENIYVENQSFFDENVDNFNSVNIPIEMTSSRYFVGYIAQRILCKKCRLDIIKPSQILTYPSEMYIHKKNYENESDFGSLCAPSDLFFEVCKIHIKVFENIFVENKSIKNIKKYIVEQCVKCTKNSVYNFWFDESNSCFKHRIEMLNILIITLLRKHCSWETHKFKSGNAGKLKILSGS